MQEVQNEPPAVPFVVRLTGGAESLEKPTTDSQTSRNHSTFSLKTAVPGRGVALHYLTIRREDEGSLRAHQSNSLLIVLRGKAELVGNSPRAIEKGDVLTLPKNKAYGFGKIEDPHLGLDALQIVFDDEVYQSASPKGVSTLEGLLALNEEMASEILKNPYFSMIRAGGLEAESKRGLFRDRLRVFSDAFQHFILTRQATCRDEAFREIFSEHLREELGHNELMHLTGPRRPFDAILEATANWFPAQMLVQDNAAKAAIHLVLETGGDYFFNLARPSFETDVAAEFFRTHAEDDERHKEMTYDLLQGLSPETYVRLQQTVVDSWNMIDAMTRRIHQLVSVESTSS